MSANSMIRRVPVFEALYCDTGCLNTPESPYVRRIGRLVGKGLPRVMAVQLAWFPLEELDINEIREYDRKRVFGDGGKVPDAPLD